VCWIWYAIVLEPDKLKQSVAQGEGKANKRLTKLKTMGVREAKIWRGTKKGNKDSERYSSIGNGRTRQQTEIANGSENRTKRKKGIAAIAGGE